MSSSDGEYARGKLSPVKEKRMFLLIYVACELQDHFTVRQLSVVPSEGQSSIKHAVNNKSSPGRFGAGTAA